MVRSVAVERLVPTMQQVDNIRNVCVVAHVDHGKTTLSDCLLYKAGILASQGSGARALDTTKEEQERGITIKSAAVSMLFDVHDKEYVVNLIDSPGHVDFSPEVTAALRLCDGALVVVDCVEGCRVQTQTVLRQAMAESVKPVLVLNKVDRAIEELCLDPEEAYQRFVRTIDQANTLAYNANVGNFGSPEKDENQQQQQQQPFRPETGTVAFGSGLHGWGFTLENFARLYAAKLGVSKDRMMDRLWGDHFYDADTKKWYRSRVSPVTGKPLKRGFVQFVLEPVYAMLKAIKLEDDAKRQAVLVERLAKVGVVLRKDELALAAGSKRLTTAVMSKFLPLADALVEMVVAHLPSPAQAQRVRVENLYTGPLDDAAAVSIRNCDPQGPLVVYVSKMVLTDPNNPSSGFLAFGRVFSGTVRSGQTVRIMGPNHRVGTTADLVAKATIRSASLLMGRSAVGVSTCPAGNVVAMSGLDRHMNKGGTISDSVEVFPIRTMRFSVSAVVRAAVEPAKVSDLPKLVNGLRSLAKVDPMVQVSTEETGEMIVAGAGELHLEVCLKQLEEFARVPIKAGNPVVTYRETVTAPSTHACLVKSANKLNRVYLSAEPLGEELVDEIETGVVSGTRDRVTVDGLEVPRYRHLVDKHGWEASDARKIWCFGPDESGPNVLVDTTFGVQHMNDARDSGAAAFQWSTKAGVLCEEALRGVRFNLVDCVLHQDGTHRGGGQLIPAFKAAFCAAQLASAPKLVEPMFLTTITVNSQTAVGAVYSLLSRRRGKVIDESIDPSGTHILEGYLPVAESFGFTADLRGATGGQGFPQCVFDHWATVPSDPLEEGSKAHDIVRGIRERKGLKASLPKLSDFEMRL